jgi:succinate dehydrogenase flavin-adding protein (antitoxin of CptAB toxin-antitoxin module)
MYKTSWSGIEEIDVIRETDQCVYVFNKYRGKEERIAKFSNYNSIFKTKDSAIRFLIEEEQKKIVSAQNQIIMAKERIEKISKY